MLIAKLQKYYHFHTIKPFKFLSVHSLSVMFERLKDAKAIMRTVQFLLTLSLYSGPDFLNVSTLELKQIKKFFVLKQ